MQHYCYFVVVVFVPQLVRAMKTINFFDVRVVDYKHKVYPFLDQLKVRLYGSLKFIL